MFHSIHSVVYPRIVSSQPMTMEVQAAAGKSNDRTDPVTGRRPDFAGPTRNDSRFFWNPEGMKHVAVVPVYGMLVKNASWIEEACMGVTDIQRIATAIAQASEDKTISKVVLDIASPGGQVTGIRELAGVIAKLSSNKQVYAFTDERCCSAAYWLASQANEVYATPSATVGSIGTYLAWLDQTVKMHLEGTRLEFFGEGEHKGMGLQGKPLSQADRELLQDRVREINGWFTSGVTSKRPGVGKSTMQGQTFTGEKSVGVNLVDGLVSGWEELLGLL